MKQYPQIKTVRGISDRRRFTRAGKIRLGIKVKNQNGAEYPKETDYFVCPEEVIKEYGEEPKKLFIMLPNNDIEDIFPQAYTWYGSSRGVKCKGDGEVAYRAADACEGDCENHEPKEIEPWHKRTCPCPLLDSKKCSLRGHLQFLLLKKNMNEFIGGFQVYQLDTGAYNSIVDVNSGIDTVGKTMELATGFYRFAMIPLELRRVPRKTMGGDSGVMQTHWTLEVICNISVGELAARRKDPGMIRAEQISLPEPIDENPELDPVDVEEVKDEEKEAPEAKEEPQPSPKEEPKPAPERVEKPKNKAPKKEGSQVCPIKSNKIGRDVSVDVGFCKNLCKDTCDLKPPKEEVSNGRC